MTWARKHLRLYTVQICPYMYIIHPKGGKIGGDYFSAQKNWRKKCVNWDDRPVKEYSLNPFDQSSINIQIIHNLTNPQSTSTCFSCVMSRKICCPALMRMAGAQQCVRTITEDPKRFKPDYWIYGPWGGYLAHVCILVSPVWSFPSKLRRSGSIKIICFNQTFTSQIFRYIEAIFDCETVPKCVNVPTMAILSL